MQKPFDVSEGRFVLNGEPVTILSGAVHYFRVVPEYWPDRLRKLKACGLNTVETYIPWNIHEPREGQFCFEGMFDASAFIRLAGSMGLHVIVRPGPFICAEWEFGGLPAWLLKDDAMRLRCSYPPFLEKVDRFYQALSRQLAPLWCTNGGPVIACQVENEYGSFGQDPDYLSCIRKLLLKHGVPVLLFTSDGDLDSMLGGGHAPDTLQTVNFGSDAARNFSSLQRRQPGGPLFCCEFWNGWFDHWGEEHHTRPPEEAAQVLSDILHLGGGVNFYMFHGGTNFGFYNGANRFDTYEPTVTSYDSDAPLNEYGDPTEKYWAYQREIEAFTGVACKETLEPVRRAAYGEVPLTRSSGLFDSLRVLSAPVRSACPQTMEKLGQDYGFVLYRTVLTGPLEERELVLQDVHDRALVYQNGVYAGCILRDKPGESDTIKLSVAEGERVRLDILVENLGRINYGPYLRDCKGVTEGVRLGLQFVFGFENFPLSLENPGALPFADGAVWDGAPRFYKGEWDVREARDTFVRLDGFEKGCVWVNGFHLGRYWNSKGPQKTLYLPGPLLREGRNEIIVFETDRCTSPAVTFTDTPVLG